MWIYQGKEFTSEDIGDYIGFVYIVTDTVTGKLYIGKKGLMTVKTLPPLKGQKKKRKKVVETDWKEYYGSNETIKAMVVEEGPERFTREIIHLCTSKGEMTYLEMKEQVVRDVLLHPDKYYNGFVGGKVSRSHIKHMIKN